LINIHNVRDGAVDIIHASPDDRRLARGATDPEDSMKTAPDMTDEELEARIGSSTGRLGHCWR